MSRLTWGILAVVALIILVTAGGHHNDGSTPTPVASTSTDVDIGESGYLRASENFTMVTVYKTQDGINKVAGLLKAGIDSDSMLYYQYIACRVASETKVLNIIGEITSAFLSGADSTRDVMVIEGPHNGCKGVVAEGHLHKTKKQETK